MKTGSEEPFKIQKEPAIASTEPVSKPGSRYIQPDRIIVCVICRIEHAERQPHFVSARGDVLGYPPVEAEECRHMERVGNRCILLTEVQSAVWKSRPPLDHGSQPE